MAYGFSVENQSGFVQVDQDFSNYVLIAEGSASTNTNISYPTQSTPPIIFVGKTPSNRAVGVQSVRPSSCRLKGFGNSVFNNSSSFDFSISYRIYGLASENVGPASGYGIRVFDGSGSVVFDSNEEFMRVRGVSIFTTNSMPDDYSDINDTVSVNHGLSGSFYVSVNETAQIVASVEYDNTADDLVAVYDIKNSNINVRWIFTQGVSGQNPELFVDQADRQIVFI